MNDRIQRITITRAKAIRTVSAVSGFNFSYLLRKIILLTILLN